MLLSMIDIYNEMIAEDILLNKMTHWSNWIHSKTLELNHFNSEISVRFCSVRHFRLVFFARFLRRMSRERKTHTIFIHSEKLKESQLS